jgi:hypothetical protein
MKSCPAFHVCRGLRFLCLCGLLPRNLLCLRRCAPRGRGLRVWAGEGSRLSGAGGGGGYRQDRRILTLRIMVQIDGPINCAGGERESSESGFFEISIEASGLLQHPVTVYPLRRNRLGSNPGLWRLADCATCRFPVERDGVLCRHWPKRRSQVPLQCDKSSTCHVTHILVKRFLKVMKYLHREF